MPGFNYMQTNFTGGQISPRLFGRIDLDRYKNGAELIHNMIVHPHGGATRRSGMEHVAEVKFSDKFTRLIRFEFSTTQAYILEFGEKYIRFYLNHGQLQTDTGVYEVASPYTEDQVRTLSVLQSNDVLYLFHKEVSPRKLLRNGAVNWSLAEIDFKNGPYLSLNQTSTGKIEKISVSIGNSLSFSKDLFSASDVGRQFRVNTGDEDDPNWKTGTITGYSSKRSVRWDGGGSGSHSDWRFGLFSDTTGWPTSGTFHEQRLVLGGSILFPSTVAFSITGDFENFEPSDTDGTVADDHGMTYTLDSDTINSIVWIKSGRRIRIGTVGQEFIIWSGADDLPITPTTIKADPESSYGSDLGVSSISVGRDVIFVNRTGRKLREMSYNFSEDGHDARDLTLLSENITIGKVVQIAYQSNPDEIIWCVLSTGNLVGLTYVKKQEVVAWHQHSMGGSFEGGHAVVDSIAVIPDPEGEYDELWAVIKRTINGATKRYIERMYRTFDEDIILEDGVFLDSILFYEGAPTMSLRGLNHLEGEEVRIVSSGIDFGIATVVNGEIPLPRQMTKGYVGLMYINELRSLKFEGGSRKGVAQGRLTRAHEVTVRLNRTLGGKLGFSKDSKLEDIFQRSAADKMGQTPALFTGDKLVNFPSGHTRGLQVYIGQTQPLPMTVLSIMPDFDVEEII